MKNEKLWEMVKKAVKASEPKHEEKKYVEVRVSPTIIRRRPISN
jgi:hypothetical protein